MDKIKSQLEEYKGSGTQSSDTGWVKHAQKKDLLLKVDEQGVWHGEKEAIEREFNRRIEARKDWEARHDDQGMPLDPTKRPPCEQKRRDGDYLDELC